ncbi:MAG: reverse transcriptase-like protein [Thermoproteota archaeon]|nr:reverse transcriptase-like protein [Thermoproteota archaeon]
MKRRRKIVVIRSDSKSTIEQLNKKTEIRDSIIQRIFNSISRILESLSCKLVFNHLNRTNNTAGKILEHIRKENNCLKVA